MPDSLQKTSREQAVKKADNYVIHIIDHENAPDGVFSGLEKAVLSWTHAIVTNPHLAHKSEGRVREELDRENRREVKAGLRQLDDSPGLGKEAAFRRLVDHQIGELAMLIGHMDGLGRFLTILRLESEEPVQIVEGDLNPATFGIKPKLNPGGEITSTGYFNTRPGLLQVLGSLVGKVALTINELLVNPALNVEVKKQLKEGAKSVSIKAAQAKLTGEF
jgi:hypothetical protein